MAVRKSLATRTDVATDRSATNEDFSLILGGPLFQLLRRTRLSGDALELVRIRIMLIVGLSWLPLLGLSAAAGHAWGPSETLPFLRDFEANVRFLVALPLLIGAELLVHQRMRPVVRQFRERRLIPDEALPRLESATAAAFRLRNSVVAELLLLAAVYTGGVTLLWRQYIALSSSTWYGTAGAGGHALSVAGLWYVYVSLPIFQFLLIRWYFRMFIWTRLLWQVSRIPLQLVPSHPDRVGGLGFLPGVAHAFTPLAVAHGALLAGVIGNRIFHAGASLPDFKVEVFVVVIFMMCLVLGPFLVFSGQLAATKRAGLRDYGVLAERYARAFDAKWIRGAAPDDDALLGAADIQSLADLDGSFDVVKSMRIVPVTRDAVIRLAAATFAPIVPLALTMMSFEDLIRKLFGMLF